MQSATSQDGRLRQQGDAEHQQEVLAADVPSQTEPGHSAPAMTELEPSASRSTTSPPAPRHRQLDPSTSPRLGSSRSSPRLGPSTYTDSRPVSAYHTTQNGRSAAVHRSRSSGIENMGRSPPSEHRLQQDYPPARAVTPQLSNASRSRESQSRSSPGSREAAQSSVPPLPGSSSTFSLNAQTPQYTTKYRSPQQTSYPDYGSYSSLPAGVALHPSRSSHYQPHHPATGTGVAYPHTNRLSAPLLTSSPPVGFGQSPNPPHAGFGNNINNEIYHSTSPMGLSDTGFGASSPYPPLGGNSSQSRFSLPSPVLLSSSPPTSFVSPAQYQQQRLSSASLRPQPTMSYQTMGTGKHLPEMHPSALEARPSASAPFPPNDSPPRFGMGPTSGGQLVAPAAVQQRERPDASRPLGQEICLECLMRDRDMADIEVTGPGIWSRASDLDFEEALRAEDAVIQQATAAAAAAAARIGGAGAGCSSIEDGFERKASSVLNGNSSTDENYFTPGSVPSTRHMARDSQFRSPSRESSLSESSRVGSRKVVIPKRRIGGGHALTASALKLWTSMVSPACWSQALAWSPLTRLANCTRRTRQLRPSGTGRCRTLSPSRRATWRLRSTLRNSQT